MGVWDTEIGCIWVKWRVHHKSTKNHFFFAFFAFFFDFTSYPLLDFISITPAIPTATIIKTAIIVFIPIFKEDEGVGAGTGGSYDYTGGAS